MNSSSTTDRLAVAIAAVAAACRVTRHVQAHQQNIVRHAKEDLSPVTVADYAAQAVVARHLADAFGGLAMVGVSSRSASAHHEHSRRRHWSTQVTDSR